MQEKILLAHGGGGLMTETLVRETILPRLDNPALAAMDDAAVLAAGAERLAFTTDGYVVNPPFFPGGSIGDLAVCGTANDLAMQGARPRWLSLALILEEGLPMETLLRVLDDVAARAAEAGVQVVCGDTKVVPRGEADRIYITTAGVGSLLPGAAVRAGGARPGDRLLVSGVLGLHGLAVMLARGNLHLDSPVRSDVAPLGAAVEALFARGIEVHALRDLTRGGLAMAVHEIAEASGATLELDEGRLPADPARDAACDLLGLDPLHIACEGRFLAVVPEGDAEAALAAVRSFPPCADAVLAGSVRARGPYPVEFVTALGSRRVLTPPRGEQLPRIC